MRLVCCLVLVLGGLQLTCAVKVAAWNIQNFGEDKANRPGILDHIAKVVRLYDVIVIQELQEKCTASDRRKIDAQTKDDKTDLTVVNKLLALLNTDLPNLMDGLNLNNNKKRKVEAYKHIVSYPLGPCKGKHRERYLYIYKTATVTPVDSCNYIGVKRFSRRPFSVKFRAEAVGQQQSFDFVLIPLHAKPAAKVTYTEINALDDVVKKLPTAWNTKNILLLGDFNAGGDYLKPEKRALVKLNEANGYNWLIGDLVSDKPATNVAGTWPYDRIVATKDMNDRHVVSGSATVKKLTDQNGRELTREQAEAVSDHYPVEVELCHNNQSTP